MNNRLLLPFFIALLSLTNIKLVAQTDLPLIGNLGYPQALSDIWGYTDPLQNEYALVGAINGLSIVDINTPSEPDSLFFIPTPSSTWQDIKTYENYAYKITEADGGLLIVDLGNLPTSIDHVIFTADSSLCSGHNLYIDELGLLYVAGFNDCENSIATNNRGVQIYDLKPNPLSPTFLTSYTTEYAHDVYVRDGKMYLSEIYRGNLSIVDISNLAELELVGQTSTSSFFTHNAWLSDNSEYIFTTDERGNAKIDAYDISNLSNIQLVDQYQSNVGSRSIPHNVHVLNDFLVISYYADGIRIIDANNPEAMVETEFHDTSPETTGETYKGCWGAFPFFNSGLVIGSDRQNGLMIIQPEYQRASYLDGKVVELAGGNNIPGAEIRINDTQYFTNTDFYGNYIFGAGNSGAYSITASAYGYISETVDDLLLSEGETLTQNFGLIEDSPFNLEVKVIDAETSEIIPNSSFYVEHSQGEYYFDLAENGTGIIDEIFTDSYTVYASKWGYLSKQITVFADSENPIIEIALERGIYDDFFFDLGWESESDSGSEGEWVLGIPSADLDLSETCNPFVDSQSDIGEQCFFTGVDDFVLNGSTTLLSPIFDLSNYTNPTLNLRYWFCGYLPIADFSSGLSMFISNGAEEVLLFEVNSETYEEFNYEAEWKIIEFTLNNYINATDEMQLKFVAENSSPESELRAEAAIDKISIYNPLIEGIEEENPPQLFSIYPNPTNQSFKLRLSNQFELNGDLRIKLYSLNGQQIAEQSIPNSSIPINFEAEIETGIYLVELININGERLRSKVVFN